MNKMQGYMKYLHFVGDQQTFIFKYVRNYQSCRAILQYLHEPPELLRYRTLPSGARLVRPHETLLV